MTSLNIELEVDHETSYGLARLERKRTLQTGRFSKVTINKLVVNVISGLF